MVKNYIIISIGCDDMKRRIVSAIIMLIIVIPLIIIGGLFFKIGVSIIAAASIYELIKAKRKDKETPLVLRIFAYIFIICLVYFANDNYSVNTLIDVKVLSILFLLFLIPIVIINNNDKYNINDALYLIGGILFISIGLNSLVIIRSIGLANIVYVLLVTIMTDTFALFTGRLIGKHKLCEKISPNKTIEGAVGGSVVAIIIGSLFYTYVINSNINLFLIIIVTLIFSVVGQIGDLLFSSIKRHYKIKDFSNLIPGHGGILDRLDSIIFVCLAYLLVFNIL